MSGIPQEMVQRLAQELLPQVRLEAALDPTPAITLVTEEAAAARVEAGLAMPEEMPSLIHPFLQRLAQPTRPVDDAAGPSTSPVQPRRNRQSSQPWRITSHHQQRTWPRSGAALPKRCRRCATSCACLVPSSSAPVPGCRQHRTVVQRAKKTDKIRACLEI